MPAAQREAVTEIIRQASPPVVPQIDDDPVDWPTELPEAPTGGVQQVATPEPEPAATRGKDAESVDSEEDSVESKLPPAGIRLSVDHVRVSENTYAFRLRWSNPEGVSPKRPAVYFQYVHRSVFELITENKDSYGQFKAQIVAQFEAQQTTV